MSGFVKMHLPGVNTIIHARRWAILQKLFFKKYMFLLNKIFGICHLSN